MQQRLPTRHDAAQSTLHSIDHNWVSWANQAADTQYPSDTPQKCHVRDRISAPRRPDASDFCGWAQALHVSMPDLRHSYRYRLPIAETPHTPFGGSITEEDPTSDSPAPLLPCITRAKPPGNVRPSWLNRTYPSGGLPGCSRWRRTDRAAQSLQAPPPGCLRSWTRAGKGPIHVFDRPGPQVVPGPTDCLGATALVLKWRGSLSSPASAAYRA